MMDERPIVREASRAARSAAIALVGSILAGLSALHGCSGQVGKVGEHTALSDACTPDLASLGTKVFTSCVGASCHNGTDRAAGLALDGADLETQLVGASSGTCEGWTRVVPGNPDQSLLYTKLAGMPPCGVAMPVGSHLSGTQVECVRGWIASLSDVDAGGGTDDAGSDACPTCGGAACVDLQTSAEHCGSCTNVCAPGSNCSGGNCLCSGGLLSCSGTCVDDTMDPKNCGGCGKACPTGAPCVGSQCSCPSGTSICNGACVPTSSDPNNCGMCGTVCVPGQVCNAGTCASGCDALTQCGASCVDTMTSLSNCGMCGKACPTGASCTGGVCACPAGSADCNGRCTSTTTNLNCGTCGNVCPSPQACQSASCVCTNGGTLCGSSCSLTASDTNNCGNCGNVCALGQTCSNGTCTCGSASVSFAGAVQPIFTSSCASNGCHGGVMPQQGLNLSSAKSYAALVNVAASQCNDGRKRVVPGSPSTSYVVQKLMGVNLCSGSQMPKAGQGLPAGQTETIANWICLGAPNN
jgi:Stigma-specific protein, Stig1